MPGAMCQALFRVTRNTASWEQMRKHGGSAIEGCSLWLLVRQICSSYGKRLIFAIQSVVNDLEGRSKADRAQNWHGYRPDETRKAKKNNSRRERVIKNQIVV